MKKRMDILLVEEGFFDSREKAKRAIMAGIVYVNGQKAYKAGTKVDLDNSKFEVRGKRLKYVGRGGLKLEKAMNHFDLDFQGTTAMDRIFNRRVHRLHASKRGLKSICCRCWVWTT